MNPNESLHSSAPEVRQRIASNQANHRCERAVDLAHPLYGRDRPRTVATIERIQCESHVFCYRENAADDGLKGVEGTFSICSFWLVEALTRAGKLEEARQNLDQMLTYANHLGLFSEEVGPLGEAYGNFPQLFTHLALTSACHALDQALGGAPSDQS